MYEYIVRKDTKKCTTKISTHSLEEQNRATPKVPTHSPEEQNNVPPRHQHLI